ncbi:glycosyltransferase family 2 protein [Roseovarius aestuarii]|uniref:glycosyltransferase family 2 protein n=1 Tax=Roseovarius aestuarii TaxID=475083 RepID=UPI001593322D|nr:glycosyltransferase [Roseovarius aestuarii]
MTDKDSIDAPVSVVVPAKDEARTIVRVIETMAALPKIDEVIVVDNNSTDETASVAAAAGARVVAEAQPGMGHAIRAGFIAARNDWVIKVDADLDRFDMSLFSRMIEARAPGVGLVKGIWQDPRDPMPMTRYLVIPALRQMYPGLGGLLAPNSGIYAFDRSLIALPELVGSYAADLDVLLRVHASGAGVAEADIGRIANNPRDPSHYASMTEVIMGFFLRKRDLRITEEIVVLAESATQVITGCLGRLVAHLRAGGRVTVFLRNPGSSAGRVLNEALQVFPTAAVRPFGDAAGFRPADTSSCLHLIAPHPSTGQQDGVRTALAMQEALDVDADILLLSVDPDGYEIADFRADTGLDIAEGLAVKQAALARLDRGNSDALPREVFETYLPSGDIS